MSCDATTKKKGREGKKLHHQTQAWSRLRFSQSPHIIHPASHTTSEHNRIEFHFLFLPSPEIQKKNTQNPSRNIGLLAESFSVDPSNGEHLHIHIVRVIGNNNFYCVPSLRSFSGRSQSRLRDAAALCQKNFVQFAEVESDFVN